MGELLLKYDVDGVLVVDVVREIHGAPVVVDVWVLGRVDSSEVLVL